MEGRNLKEYFQAVYGTPMKKEEIVETICRAENFRRDEMCFVGDALTDKMAALHTGLNFIGRNTEENAEDFKDVIYRVDNLLQMEKILEGM